MNKNKPLHQAPSEHARKIALIYQERFPKLMAIAARYGHPTEACKDIVQDAIANVLNAKEAGGIKELHRYVAMAVRNRALDQVRAAARRRPTDELLHSIAQLAATSPSPETECLDAQIAATIKNIESNRADWRRVMEVVTSQARDKGMLAPATKLSLRVVKNSLLRKVMEVLDLPKNRKRDVK